MIEKDWLNIHLYFLVYGTLKGDIYIEKQIRWLLLWFSYQYEPRPFSLLKLLRTRNLQLITCNGGICP